VLSHLVVSRVRKRVKVGYEEPIRLMVDLFTVSQGDSWNGGCPPLPDGAEQIGESLLPLPFKERGIKG